jgi:hypothetical protein
MRQKGIFSMEVGAAITGTGDMMELLPIGVTRG